MYLWCLYKSYYDTIESQYSNKRLFLMALYIPKTKFHVLVIFVTSTISIK